MQNNTLPDLTRLSSSSEVAISPRHHSLYEAAREQSHHVAIQGSATWLANKLCDVLVELCEREDQLLAVLQPAAESANASRSESSLVAHAQAELEDAGYFDDDSDYKGKIGPAVMELIKVFAAQGHSGMSAEMVRWLFVDIASFGLLTPLQSPIDDGRFQDRSESTGAPAGSFLQSTRLSAVFSEDGGRTWFDIAKKRSSWEWLRRSKRAYITFPYRQTSQ